MKLAWLLISIWVSGRAVAMTSERCDDWGVIPMQQTQIYDGEPARIRCPLFQDFLKHNYSTAHSAGLTLVWYRIRRDMDLEEPINFRLPDNRITKAKEALWFKPAVLNDTGNYTCMLRNTSYCSKVAFPLEVLQKDPGSCVSRFAIPEIVEFPAGHFEILTCPDIDGFYPANETPAVSWYLGCKLVHNFVDRHPQGANLTFTDVMIRYEGNYTCILTYEEHGRRYDVTRTSTMKVIGSPLYERPPIISQSIDKVVQEIEAGDKAQIYCRVEFSFVKGSRTDVWWTIDGKNAGDLLHPRINLSSSVQEQDLGKKTITSVLSIKDVTAEDLKRNYTCVARNDRGQVSWQALLKLKVPPPRYIMELACGLGVTLCLVVALIVIYHVYWLEMVLFYRAHFGTDETVGDGKEYDVYVSYARNAEEEEFVLLTLRGVLENEFGYKLCIFDRDSLPGGILTDETLTFINKSRRLLVILSPNYACEGTQAFLELKAGLSNMASQGSIRVILVQYKSIKNTQRVKDLKRAQAALSVIRWKGEKSKYPGGRFWKQLHVALPSKKLHAGVAPKTIATYSEQYSLSPYSFTTKTVPVADGKVNSEQFATFS